MRDRLGEVDTCKLEVDFTKGNDKSWKRGGAEIALGVRG
jgi:hypothetical protein